MSDIVIDRIHHWSDLKRVHESLVSARVSVIWAWRHFLSSSLQTTIFLDRRTWAAQEQYWQAAPHEYDHKISSIMEIVPGEPRVDETFAVAKNRLEKIAIAQRLKAVFTNIKILLEGCNPAKDTIQFLLDKLNSAVNSDESADEYVRDEVATLVILLCKCSGELLDADSIKDCMRVEVVKRLLFSTLQEFTVPLEGLTHLEKLTQEQYRLQREFSAYGYEGITLTGAGSLEIATTKLVDSGKLALQNACLLEPFLVDEMITFWFWSHFRQLAGCFFNLKKYEGAIPWFEAALKVAKFALNLQVTSNRELGLSFHSAATRSADTEKTKEWYSRGMAPLRNFITLLDNANCPPVEASQISQAHLMIGEGAYVGLNDASLALQHFAKGAEIAATNSLHLRESENALQCGVVIFETMRDKLEEIRASFRRSLEAVLKAIPGTDEVRIILAHIHRTTIWVRGGILTHIEKLRSEPDNPTLRDLSRPQLSSLDALWAVPTSWIVARVRAYYVLGFDYFYQRELEKAVDMMLRGLKILDAEPGIDENWPSQSQILSAVMHSMLGEMYYITAKFKEAVEHFQLCGQVHESQGISLFECGDSLGALEVFKELSSKSLTDSGLCKRRAKLLAWKGLVEYLKGDMDECIVSFEAARKANKEENTLHIHDLVALHINLVQAYLKKHEYRVAFDIVKIFQPIVDQHYKGEALWQIWQSIKATGHQMVGDLLSADKAIEQMKAPDRNDPVGAVTNLRSTELMVLMSRSSLYRSQADTDSALDGYDQIEELINDSEGEDFRLLGENFNIKLLDYTLPEIHLNRAAALMHTLDEPQLQRSCRESEQAALLLRKEGGREVLLARALACQAVAKNKLSRFTRDHLHSKVEELIDEAIALIGSRDSLLLARFKYIKAITLWSNNPSMAEAEGREAVLIFASHQLQLRDMESAWVSMFGLEMKHLFFFMQNLSFSKLGMPMKALLWAERGRTRLFAYIVRKQEDMIDVSSVNHANDHDTPQSKLVDSLQDDLEYVQLNNPGKVSCSKEEWPGQTNGEICNGCQQVSSSTSNRPHESVKDTYDNVGDTAEFSGLDELWFDKDDALAEKYLFQAVEQCGPEALILEYTHQKLPKERLFIYAVFMRAGNRHEVEYENVDVEAIINERKRESKKKWIWGRTLATLISKTREYIVKKADDKAMEGLSLLHSILIEPMEKYVKACQRLILCIHERLALVPFAALLDKQSGNFLVQEKTISYISSIRVLHYCFHRQRIFERQMQNGLLDTPFVAGNPEPMGWRMNPLPGAAEEAKLVAEMLGVRPCTGSDMTKEAVTAGLSNASMVLLATHGVVDTYFPHGALILQDCNSTREDERSSSSLARGTTSGLRGHFFQRLQDSPNGTVTGSSAIISDELASLPGGIRAGLVVLSTCKSGEGEVTSEGLLGLGRALLQGGAPAAILALWEVADSSNKVLIVGVFEQLVRHGKDVAEALRQVMLKMIESKEKKYHIFHWAPLVALGTPTFKYAQGPQSLGRSEA